MASKTLTLVSPDGKHTVKVDNPAQENHYKWNGYTVSEDSEQTSLAPRRGPRPTVPATSIELPSKDDSTPTEAAKGK
jgi:hypothetical protein